MQVVEFKISAFREFKKILICCLLFFLIVPIIILIITILEIKKDTWELGQDKLIHRYGLFSKNEHIILVKDITEANVSQTLWGRMFKFGDVSIGIIGKRNMHIQCVKNPEEAAETLRKYIEKARTADIKEVLAN